MTPMTTESSDIADSHASEPGPVVEQSPSAPPTVVPEVFEADPRLDSPVQNVIPYRNQWALTGYYLGVFSLIPVAGILLGSYNYVIIIMTIWGGLFGPPPVNNPPMPGQFPYFG
jgi:hypothetical protein